MYRGHPRYHPTSLMLPTPFALPSPHIAPLEASLEASLTACATYGTINYSLAKPAKINGVYDELRNNYFSTLEHYAAVERRRGKCKELERARRMLAGLRRETRAFYRRFGDVLRWDGWAEKAG